MTGLSGHIIICGMGVLGVRIVEQLHAFGEPMVVILYAHDSRLETLLERWGVPCLLHGASGSDAFADAGIDTAAAVVCADPSDVVSLETALTARRLRPDVRVVTRIANTVVRDAVEQDNGPGAVLAVADLAAPSVVEDCLRRTTHQVDVAGIDLTVVTDRIGRDATLRELYGDLAPLAVAHGAENPYAAEVIPSPPRDTTVSEGDWVCMIGSSDELIEHGLLDSRPEPDKVHAAPTDPRRVRPRRRGPVARASVVIRELIEDLDPNFFRAMAVMAVLVVTSTVIFRFTYTRPGMSVLDALYFSAETIATVGYGDFSFLGQPPALRIYAIFLMVCGVTNTAILVAFVSEVLVSRRLSKSAGRRRARMMSGHVVLVGLGEVGIRVATELISRGQTVVAIEMNPDHANLPVAEKLGVSVVFGDGTVRETLLAAGVQRSSAVALLASNEMANIEAGLVLKEILGQRWDDGTAHPTVPVVLRVFDLPLGRVVAQRFGFRNVRSTVELAAPWFIAAALGLRVIGTFSVWQDSYMVGAVTIEPRGGLDGVRLRDLSPATRVVAIDHTRSGTVERNPRRDSRFDAGDIAYMIGPYAELISVLRLGRAV
ncbi:NAD-binding protein [Williamsia sterculiae]|nr:NAD-binding protein [Williamsia sterculiae]